MRPVPNGDQATPREHGFRRDDALTRRAFLALGSAIGPIACATGAVAHAAPEPGRVAARPPSTPSAPPLPPGESPLGFGGRRDGLLYVPRQSSRQRLPLLVLLHGATGSARGVTNRTSAFDLADELGIVVLAPESRDVTWDIATGEPGPDLQFIDRSLDYTFSRVPVDRRRLAVGGFSDGASYALSLGLTNGDLFSHVIAFSPGFMRVRRAVGHPLIFISHGTCDPILPAEETSRTFVPDLESAGYTIRYREFAGGHTVPEDVAREAFRWMAGA